MRIYTVHAPPAGDRRAADPTAFAFIKEGFCWPALFFPAIWILVRRLWLVFLGFLIVSLGLGWLGDRLGGPLPGLILVLAWLLFAVEANGLRRWTLERRGWRFVGVAEGSRIGDAEQRFFPAWIAAGARVPEPPAPLPPPEKPSAEAGQVVGMFPLPGGKS
ncbi:MAG: DUF2628 domain-containing protein [Bauldia sp.]